MLVLTRRPGEQIVIGDGIRITVVSVGPGRVKIGVDAPANIRVDRQEIHDKIQHEQATDVLATVGRHTSEDTCPTMVVNSGDTSTGLHNRIAVALPSAEATATQPTANAGSVATPSESVNRLSKHRLPRKSR